MTKKYTPATFQPTIRPSWAGILSYIDANEKAEILDAIICFPNECLGGVKSRFYNETIKPDLYEQYDKFLKICDIRGRSAKTYWGEQKLSKSLTCDKHKDNLLKDKDKDKDKVKDKVKDNQEGGNRGKPTIQEVIDYCNERNNHIDPNEWFNYYSANGWKVGRNPMKDWKACVRYWEQKHNSTQPLMNARKKTQAELIDEHNLSYIEKIMEEQYNG